MVETTKTLYDELGAEIGIRRVVDDFYDRIVADSQLAPYFVAVDMANLRRHQVSFLSAATGGPSRYAGPSLAEAHAQLAVTDYAFDSVVTHLLASLEAFGVEPDTVSQVVAALSPLRSDIVSSA